MKITLSVKFDLGISAVMNPEFLRLSLHLSNVQAATLCAIKLNERVLEQLEEDSCSDAKLMEQLLQLLAQIKR